MKKLIITVLSVLLVFPPFEARPAINAAAVWEVRTAGNDTNGGAFRAGGTGTDFSQQNGKRTAGDVTDISVTDAVAIGTGVITSITANFTAAIVNNVVYMAGGTGALAAGWYEVTARASATSITVDRNVGAGTGITMNIGGALATINQAVPNVVSGNAIWVKAGAYTTVATITALLGSGAAHLTEIRGYNATRGDGGRPTLQLSTNAGLTALAFSTYSWRAADLIIDCNSLGTSTGMSGSAAGMTVERVKVINCATLGIGLTGVTSAAYDCEVTGMLVGATAALQTGLARGCYIHDNVSPGITTAAVTTPLNVSRCLIVNNTGATSDGIYATSYTNSIESNTIHGNGRDGVRFTQPSNVVAGRGVRNNLLTSNVGYGLYSSDVIGASPEFDGNAYWNNGGTRFQLDSVAGIWSIAPYTNVHDKALAGNPYTNSVGGDFSLNNTAGAGATCRGAGLPGTWPGSATGAGYPDLGAVQHADLAGFQTSHASVK